ncbi:MAG: biopolymer transporter ExbD [Pyrinomonadaceae bacterium MAG19_C2-C3]|nr:biopolymer transporter ExbD [Pyrinomonadaceae bacterium MAG19_C2-C3]
MMNQMLKRLCAFLFAFGISVAIYYALPERPAPLELKASLAPCRLEGNLMLDEDAKPQPCINAMAVEQNDAVAFEGFDPYLIREGCTTPLYVAVDSEGFVTGIGFHEEFESVHDYEDMGYNSEFWRLRDRLRSIFDERIRNRAFQEELGAREDLPMNKRIIASVVVLASCSVKYQDVLRVMDAVKASGANQISLQVQDCDTVDDTVKRNK